MSLSSVNFSGLSTGIDTESIIKQMISLDQRPQKIMQDSLTKLQQKQAAYNTVSAQLLNLQATTSVLDKIRAFDIVTATSSDETVATVSAQTGAQLGTYAISVTNLAKAQTVSTTQQTSQTAPLGFTGQILVNGKAINVQASDSLTTLAGNINAAQVGVTASILSPTPNNYFLTLSSTNTGVQGQITLSDTAGNSFLGGTLGILGAGTSLRNPVSGTVAGSSLFADSATSIATLQGQTAVPPTIGNVTINGTAVTIDLSKSLSGIAADINTALGGSPAQVVQVTDPISGATKQQLQITGVNAAANLVDDKNVLANLGLIQKNYGAGRQLTAAQDANFTLNGLTASRPTNSFSDAISGVTINLLKDGGAATNLTVSSDTQTIKDNVNNFIKAFNGTIDTISGLSQYDPSTGSTGVLFGDGNVQSVVDGLVSNATGQISGLPSSLSLLSQVGINLDQGNHLTLDDSKLSSALSSNLQGVAQLFRAYGAPTDPAVQFVSATSDTRPSGTTGYAVSVTQAATQGTVNASAALGASLLGQDETLTFGGPLFGSGIDANLTGGYSVSLRAGGSLNDIVTQLNADTRISRVLSAFNNGGKLQLISKQYGAAAEFAVKSSIPTTTLNTSGIGTTVLDQKGTDIIGTINGEPATGYGQFLTGSLRGTNGGTNGKALGLQLRVTATAPGSYGTVQFTSGAADVLQNYITSLTDVYSGTLSSAANSLDENIKDLQASITDMGDRLKNEETVLRDRFAAMETAVAQIKSSSAGLAQLGVTIK